MRAMREDILTNIINRLRQTGMDQVEAQLMLINLILELKNSGVITINDDKLSAMNKF